MYRVGFGDFFLLTFTSAGKIAHVLIDCGVHAKPTNSIGEAIDQMAKETQSHLALIIVTHRHADHISGFAMGANKFAGFTVDQIWMPWFENPDEPSAVSLQKNLVRVARSLQLAFAVRSGGDDQYSRMAENITGEFDAAGSSLNDQALSVIHGGFSNNPPIDYLKAGDTPHLPASLSELGVRAQILGPPIDPKLIVQMDNKTHQYLDQLEADISAVNRDPIFDKRFVTDASRYTSNGVPRKDLRAMEKRLAASQPDVVEAMAQQADNTLNNQSLVTLFEFAGKKLLFAGDAQWGNWQNFLFGGAFGTPGHETLSSEAQAILGSIDFYKVGHHGSTNATPIDALNAMRGGMAAMCSTAENAYNQVPRGPLLAALNTKTDGKIARSDQVKAINVAPINQPLNAAFKAPAEGLFIDYNF
jgi:beta-lactamase superfamily II metal-dependent hydrolase